MTRPTATVLITTKNRRDELPTAIESALAQSARPQVLVIDDGSTDGTSDLVRSRFPNVTLHRYETSQGLIGQRNNGARLASGDVVFSIDDDAAFPSPETVAQTLAEFDHPRVAAVAIPFINVKQDQTVRQIAPDADGIWITQQYIGTAHAIRRDLFNSLGGYKAMLIHQGEESDYTVRLLDRGYVVRMGRADPIHHFESPRRDFRRMDLFGRRNDILFCWHNVPASALPGMLAEFTLRGIKHGIRTGRLPRMLQGLGLGYGYAAKRCGHRDPVRRATWDLFKRLAKTPARLRDVESNLASLP